ncbi:hypothetical protein [Clostridium sp. CF012]|uniref:hypothetical protein n=1 Tax=Clostridium sp. CF012 TaxID=2843319 RepID=UPI001C0D0FB6|nr:hypothetical protein [Clostridium sp. CF012]MBU3143996.1 hypothetical protein [Clostridium sp. CF012]
MDKDKLKLTNRDLYWIIAILTGIVILVCAVRFSNKIDLINIFTFMASGISIALAFVAIGMSIKQESTSNILNSETRNMLSAMNEKIIGLDFKISNIDFQSIQELTLSGFNKLEDKISKITLGDNTPEKLVLKEAISKEINEAKEETSKQIETILNKNINSIDKYFYSNPRMKENSVVIKDIIAKCTNKYTDDEWSRIIRDTSNDQRLVDQLQRVISKIGEK